MDKVSRIIKHIPVRVHLDTTNRVYELQKKKRSFLILCTYFNTVPAQFACLHVLLFYLI